MTPQRQTKTKTLLRIGIDVQATLARIPRKPAGAASSCPRTKITEMKAGWAINPITRRMFFSWAKTAL
jgi:hypothetical protein